MLLLLCRRHHFVALQHACRRQNSRSYTKMQTMLVLPGRGAIVSGFLCSVFENKIRAQIRDN